jgi:hypothetical protein
MFEFNPKLLLFIPASVIFYKLLSQKEEVNEYPFCKYRKSLTFIERKQIEYNIKMIKERKEKMENRQKLLKIMKDEILEREMKLILNEMIGQVIINVEKEKLKKEKLKKEKLKLGLLSSVSYLSYFNISKFIHKSIYPSEFEKEFEHIDLSSDDSYEKI